LVRTLQWARFLSEELNCNFFARNNFDLNTRDLRNPNLSTTELYRRKRGDYLPIQSLLLAYART
jgi:hypothetical protein